MINLDIKKYNEADKTDYGFIKEPDNYHARLIMTQLTMQDKYIEEGKEPARQLNLVFDVLDDEGKSYHIKTEPMNIPRYVGGSSGKKSNLEKFFEKVVDFDKTSLTEFLYEDGHLKDLYFKVSVEVDDQTEKGKGVYNRVSGLVKLEEPTGQKVTELRDYDFVNKYGREILQGDINPAYKPKEETTEEESDFFKGFKG